MTDVALTGVEHRFGPYGGQYVPETLMPSLAAERRNRTPLIVAGGLTADNVGEAIELIRPFGVDVASGVESEPGVKDPERLRAFMAAVERTHAGAGA